MLSVCVCMCVCVHVCVCVCVCVSHTSMLIHTLTHSHSPTHTHTHTHACILYPLLCIYNGELQRESDNLDPPPSLTHTLTHTQEVQVVVRKLSGHYCNLARLNPIG